MVSEGVRLGFELLAGCWLLSFYSALMRARQTDRRVVHLRQHLVGAQMTTSKGGYDVMSQRLDKLRH